VDATAASCEAGGGDHLPQSQVSSRASSVMSQPLLAPLNSLGHFSVLARVTSAYPSHSAMLKVSSPKPRTLKFVGKGPTLLHLHSGLTAQSVTIGVRWTSIHGSPPLS
jgi:hypothetical protein